MQVHCAFRVHDCPHGDEPLFSTEYKRSNRTRMSKILRCFPHCCPTHRPRSYCGSALHLHVSLVAADEASSAQADQADSEDEHPLWTLENVSPSTTPTDIIQRLTVYGRFEVHDPDEPLKTFLTLGQRVTEASLQNSEDPTAIWIQGRRFAGDMQPVTTDVTPIASQFFVLNEENGVNHHWEYDWRSGTSQRKRASLHQFRAYVFQVDSTDPSMWQVVGMVGSTPFTLSSYRKQDEDEAEGGEATSQPARPAANQEATLPRAPRFVSPPPPPRSTAIDDALITRYHQPTVQATTRLAIWIKFLSVVDISWVSTETVVDHAVAMLQGSHESQLPAAYVHHTASLFARRGAHTVAHALAQASPVPYDPYSYSAWFQKWHGLVKVCVDVLSELFADGRLRRLRAHVRQTARDAPWERDEQRMRSSYIAFVDLLSSELDQVVRMVCEHESLDQLVDEMISSVYFHDPEIEWISESTRTQMRSLLRNTRLLGIDWYREQLRLCARPPQMPVTRSDLSVLYSGLWAFVSVEEDADQPRYAAQREFSFSVISAIGALTASQAFEMVMDAEGTRLLCRSDWGVFSEAWSELVLDGQVHTTSTLPHGLISSLWLDLGAGAVVGDYRGALRQLEDATIVLEIDAFAISSDAPSFCLQITAVPTTAVVNDAQVPHLRMHARVYRAAPSARALELTRPELEALTPEQRCELVQFSASDLIVQLTYFFEQTLAFSHHK